MRHTNRHGVQSSCVAGSLSALAEHLQPHQMAAAADHASVETAFKCYLERTVEQRVANTGLIAAGFNKAASTPMFGARMTNGDIPP